MHMRCARSPTYPPLPPSPRPHAPALQCYEQAARLAPDSVEYLVLVGAGLCLGGGGRGRGACTPSTAGPDTGPRPPLPPPQGGMHPIAARLRPPQPPQPTETNAFKQAAKAWSDLTFYHDVASDRERQLVNQKALEFASRVRGRRGGGRAGRGGAAEVLPGRRLLQRAAQRGARRAVWPAPPPNTDNKRQRRQLKRRPTARWATWPCVCPRAGWLSSRTIGLRWVGW